jgi:two-component system phosphate regulon sensor histidine kinase PhoR
MEKRIRIVWGLSLASALLVIGVQAYWLANQYDYVTDTFAGELAARVWQAGEEEYEGRKQGNRSPYTYIIRNNAKYESSDSLSLQTHQIDFRMYRKEGSALADTLVSLPSDSLLSDSLLKDLPPEAKMLRLTWNAALSVDSLQASILRAVVNLYNPFRLERMDSLLTALLPAGTAYALSEPQEGDTILPIYSHWERTGGRLHPALRAWYAYSPLEYQGVWVEMQIPPQPVFRRMAIQLALACGLMLLLAACLIFQIRTILRQKKLSELRESFVGTMVHELRRPVQTLKTFVAFLADKEMRADEPLSEQVAHDAMFELDNLSAYLNKLKDMLRADSTATPLHITDFDLRELTEKVIRLTPRPAGKEVSLTARYDLGASPRLAADPVHVANMLDNLIENAVKYSPASVRIEVSLCRGEREVRLCVADNGIGIPVGEQGKVFDKFYRGSNLPDKAIPGMGLGLSYVKLITEAHGGTVALVSRPGEGTSVTLSFPQ